MLPFEPNVFGIYVKSPQKLEQPLWWLNHEAICVTYIDLGFDHCNGLWQSPIQCFQSTTFSQFLIRWRAKTLGTSAKVGIHDFLKRLNSVHTEAIKIWLGRTVA